MKVHLASHYGMCFGVRDALRVTHAAAKSQPVTVLGQLVHNPQVQAHLKTLGAKTGSLENLRSAQTNHVVITAHGAAESQRAQWRSNGHVITDTTCPLVKKAHLALKSLVDEGYHPIVIGEPLHAEVRGLVGDFPQAQVVLSIQDIEPLPRDGRPFGIISQTTQPLSTVLERVDEIKRQRPHSELHFIDTVCRPTQQRQTAIEELCSKCSVIVVVGGRNSNNTKQLQIKAEKLGARTYLVECAADLQAHWFTHVTSVGVTAGTSTLDETVDEVVCWLHRHE
jgi:4-hydroxy-3-methylbut-2-en-1-yl diphosphate reductase